MIASVTGAATANGTEVAIRDCSGNAWPRA